VEILIAVSALNLARMVSMRRGAFQIVRETGRVDPELPADVRHDVWRDIGRIGQKRPQETHPAQLHSKP
jgi:hypothetical protein